MHSLDLLDRFHFEIPDVTTVEIVIGPVEAATPRVAEALGADFGQATCFAQIVTPPNIVFQEKLKCWQDSKFLR